MYAGNVGTGFNDQEIDRLLGSCGRSSAKTPPFEEVPKMPRVRKDDVVWVEPKLVAEVEFAEWTHDGHLRAPVVQGAARGQEPEDVRREEPMSRPRSGRASAC